MFITGFAAVALHPDSFAGPQGGQGAVEAFPSARSRGRGRADDGRLNPQHPSGRRGSSPQRSRSTTARAVSSAVEHYDVLAKRSFSLCALARTAACFTLGARQAILSLFVPGGTHAPHQPTPEWIKKISDMHLFDQAGTGVPSTGVPLPLSTTGVGLAPWVGDLQLAANERGWSRVALRGTRASATPPSPEWRVGCRGSYRCAPALRARACSDR